MPSQPQNINPAKNAVKYFLPYQLRWLHDTAPIKVWEKSRRIGATYVQSFEDVNDILTNPKIPAVWFSSADESAAKEYILYCSQWAQLFDKAARDLGEVILDDNKAVKAFQIVFSNGKRITALSSNPKAFRSKGGKVVLDEFAHHEDQAGLWKSAKPAITWGFPLRILSTHNGKSCLYYKFVDRIKSGKQKWSLHTTDIFLAAKEGLVSKILNREAAPSDIDAWLRDQQADAGDEITWQEEFCCQPVDEASAFLSYELIRSCEVEQLSNMSLASHSRVEFLGVDIGRRKDLTVIWHLRKLADVNYTVEVKVLEKAPFAVQRDVLYDMIERNRIHRVCIDSTGLGMQLAEECQNKFGKYKIEAVMFTQRSKEEMAFDMLSSFQDRLIRIPADNEIREDLHSVRKITTSANNIRFDVNATELKGHADRFWALALALHAGKTNLGPVIVKSRKIRRAVKIFKNYF